ncbi:hypothetical protein GQ55_8G016200 [Panicum hallii var. hallii]|uniref:Uncharacterized protein n=1 Tax=Panicum hallii var. hallii TaxID=1504633 RepID=A0A2T7CJK9_9POAL|nr:hypothetical protein GQ55_8G016200 [Panicum hallii var. hallii]
MGSKLKSLHKRLQNSLGPIFRLQLERFSHPLVPQPRIDFACYGNRYINNFSTKLTTYPYYYAARSFLKGSGASSRVCASR